MRVHANIKHFEKNFNIKFTNPDVNLHTNGFISVQLDWVRKKNIIPTTGDDDYYNFKYVSFEHTMWGGEVVYKRKKHECLISAAFNFPSVKKEVLKEKNIMPWFDISLIAESKEDSDEMRFDYLFFENIKYGIIAWFAPRGWEEWDKTIVLQ